MGYEISFQTIQRYCKYRITHSRWASTRYGCNKKGLVSLREFQPTSDDKCTEANCPLLKRLFRLYT